MAESGLSYGELYPGTGGSANTFDYKFHGFNEDPVIRWKAMVTMYSALDLTYVDDRLPAIAAIVEREMRHRKDDTYIAGMWVSSLLVDLLWEADDDPAKQLPRLSNSIPTWSWASSQARVHWDYGVIVPSLTLVDVSFTRLGPAHIGEVRNASITLEGHTYTTRLKSIYEPGYGGLRPCMDLISPPCENIKVTIHRNISTDFDWTRGHRPVAIGDTFLAMPVNVWNSVLVTPSFQGIVLREVADGNFERMGIIYIHPVCGHEVSEKERGRLLSDFLETMPIRRVKII